MSLKQQNFQVRGFHGETNMGSFVFSLSLLFLQNTEHFLLSQFCIIDVWNQAGSKDAFGSLVRYTCMFSAL